MGCVSAPTIESSSISARILNRDDLSKILGANRFENPFIEPISLIFGQQNEFVVIEIMAKMNERDMLSIAAELIPAESLDRIEPMYLEQFKDFWAHYVEPQGSDRREGKLDTYCLPGPSIIVPKGSHRYFLVFVGPKPLPRPAKVLLSVVLGNSPMPQVFDMEVQSQP